MSKRELIVAAALSYVGTPFHHLGRLPGVGLDCAGLLICAAREAGCVAAEFDVPAYAMRPDGATMLAWCDKHMRRISRQMMMAGDAVLVAIEDDPQHLGILYAHEGGGLGIVHAAGRADGTGSVIQHRLTFERNRKFIAAFRLPGV